MSKLPETRAEAKAAKSPRYNTGKPCKHGHVADRFTSTANCVVCSDISRKKSTKAEDPAQRQARNNRWKAKNGEKLREYYRNTYYKNIEARRAAQRAYYAKNREENIARAKQWRANNPCRSNSHGAKRRSIMQQATPSWLTHNMQQAILDIYAARNELSSITGVKHEVDHIVPLQGGTVCGLHVPWNLRVIPADENNRRPRIWKSP